VSETPERAKTPLRKWLRSGCFLLPDTEKALKSRAFGQKEKVGNFYQNYLPFVDLFHCFDRIIQREVHLPFRGVNRVQGGVHLQKGGSKGTIAKLKGARIIIR